jgi:hypothetical protein
MLSQRMVCAVLAVIFLVCPDSSQSQKRKGKTVRRKKPAVTQTMTNSPGGIQAAGDVTINPFPPERHLTPQQRATFLEITKGKPKGEIEMRCVAGSALEWQSCKFAKELQSLLIEAGWTVPSIGRAIYLDDPPIGLSILVESAERAPAHAVVLQQSLGAIDLLVPGQLWGKHKILLMVGVNPTN